jgi:D-alanyl-D-alanine carboxypeptidase
MKQRALAPVLRTLALAAMMVTSALFAPAALAEKYASIVVDMDTHEVLHARNADETRYPASLTKVMTLYMLFDALEAGELTLDERLMVSRFAANQAPSNLKLRPNTSITVRDAIGALVTKSANDVAVVVAERLGRTETRFAQLMTVKAKSLGLENTRFTNASGLPDTRQVSTARDLAILAEAIITNHGASYHYFTTPRFSWGGKTYKNHNELLTSVDGVDGIKTGYTRASGFNLMTSAKRDGHRIIVIMLGGSTSKSRNAHVTALVEAAFDSYQIPDHPDDPDRRIQIAFSAFNGGSGPNPDAAAEPMLNGQRLSVATAAKAIKFKTLPAPVFETEPEEEELQEILVADAGKTLPAEFEQGDATPTSFEGATVVIPAGRPAFTVSEYEARQFGQ